MASDFFVALLQLSLFLLSSKMWDVELNSRSLSANQYSCAIWASAGEGDFFNIWVGNNQHNFYPAQNSCDTTDKPLSKVWSTKTHRNGKEKILQFAEWNEKMTEIMCCVSHCVPLTHLC